MPVSEILTVSKDGVEVGKVLHLARGQWIILSPQQPFDVLYTTLRAVVAALKPE